MTSSKNILCHPLPPLETQGDLQPGDLQSTTDRGGWEHLHSDPEKGKEDNIGSKPKHHTAHRRVHQLVANKVIDLAIGESGIEAETPITVGQLLQNTVTRFPVHPALKYKEEGIWKTITYTVYYNLCIRAAKSFLKVRVG